MEDVSLQLVGLDEQELADEEARRIAEADPSGMALSPTEWKANRWLEGWIHTPRSTTTHLEGEKHVMANVACPVLLNIHSTCETGECQHCSHLQNL